MSKVLIVGGAGYLGARLSKHLAENGHRVTVFDSFDPSKYCQWTKLMEKVIVGDIRDETTLFGLTECEYDVAIHLISLDHKKSEGDPNEVCSINVMPTWRLLDRLTGKGLKKFIYLSTIHIYGKLPEILITEDHPPSPQNVYGLTHLLSENICNYFNETTDTTCINVRLSNSYGSPVFNENDCWWLVINDLCRTAFSEKLIKLLSDGSPQRDFIHWFDICKAIEILIEAKSNTIKDNTFHIASGKTMTILEIAHTVKRIYKGMFGIDIPIFSPDNTIAETSHYFENNKKYHFSTSKIESLGFKNNMDLSAGVSEMFEYLSLP